MVMRRYLIFLVLFAILEIGLALYLTLWREHFWNAVSNKESLQFMQQLGVFTCVALVICLVSGISGYLVSLTAIKWREKLNASCHAILRNEKYVKVATGARVINSIENMPQRIQEDCMTYPTLVLTLGFGLIKAITYVLVFSVSLLWSFSWWFLIVLLMYTLCGLLITKYVAHPLIQLNYDQQRAEATYRSNLNLDNFGDCVRIMLGLAKKQKHLTYFQQFYGQVGVVVPLIIIAPTYFTTGMTLGELMRFNSLGSTILENMSYGISSFADINRLLSCRKRLMEAKIL